jgi:hypothetical protein
LTAAVSALRTHGMGRKPKPGAIRQQGRQGRKAVAVYLEVQRWRELKMIAVLTESTLDKLLQDGATMVVEKFKRTRTLSLES